MHEIDIYKGVLASTVTIEDALERGKNVILRQVMEIFELLDKPDACGREVADFLCTRGATQLDVQRVKGKQGFTDFIKVVVEGRAGKRKGGVAPTLGVIGRLGGIGARPHMVGYVSDGDGALTALAVALKLVEMQTKGDLLIGDVMITTHICPKAPIRDHHPVPFMSSPVDMKTMNRWEVDGEMDAILSIDTTKGNRVINTQGFAISPTVKEGYILKCSDALLDVMMQTTGKIPRVFPLSQQDITPYGNGVYHLNSIMQPAVATSAPVVGVAITTEVPIAGCATGASHSQDVEQAGRFVVEVAKSFGRGQCPFYDSEEYQKLLDIYGDLRHFQLPR